MGQKIGPLSAEHAAHNETQRGWLRDQFDEDSRHDYDSVEGKVAMLDSILRSDRIGPGESWKLQSLGVTFGDILVQKLGLDWVSVEDDYGNDPGLQDPQTTVLLFPLTAISKRVEQGESVDIRALLDYFCKTVIELRDKAAHGRS